MIQQNKLEDYIKQNLILGNAAANGFHAIKCSICNDYKPRGGFKFENNEIGYNCFNCGKSARYEEYCGHISKNMLSILIAFGLNKSEILNIVNSSFFIKKKEEPKITLSSLQKINTNTPIIKLPNLTYQLGAIDEHISDQKRIIEYLIQRQVDLNQYSFFFSKDPLLKDYVLIPFYRNNQLIYWQARSILNIKQKRYINCTVSRDAVLFNFDELYSYSSLPLFISEGVFDAMMFNGIATLGSSLNDAKIELLKKSNRRLIFIIDKDKNGAQLAKQVLSLGWEISFSPDGSKDINDSVIRFGKIWTANELLKNITNNYNANLNILLKCK